MMMTTSGRTLTIVALALGIAACGGDSPTTPTPTPPSPSPAPTAAPPTPAPSANQPPALSLRVNPDPALGEAPLQVHLNMCRSTDPDPADALRFSVDFGDGVSASGDCALDHTYGGVGAFRARACVTDGQAGGAHTQCQSFTVNAVPVNLPPDISNLRVSPEGHSTSGVSFALWDEHEPVGWVASVKAGTPGTYAGCFQVPSGCFDSVAGESKVGTVQISYRDGIAGPSPGRNFVIITIRSVDPQGKQAQRSLEYTVF